MDAFARIEIWVVIAYLAITMGIAWRVSARSRTVEGYTVGNRNMAGWVIGLSVLATFASSITFLGLPGKVYADGNWNAYVFSLSLPIAAWIGVAYFVPLYRHKVQLSAYELLEARFGYWARAYADVCYVVLQLGRIATVLLLVAVAVSELLEIDIITIIIALGVLVIIYDTLGGIQAVIWTDVLQVIVLVGGALWCLIQLVFTFEGGPSAFFAAVPADAYALGADGHTSLETYFSLDLAKSTVFVILIYGITENLRNYGTDQNYVQRFLAARSDRDAGRSIWIGALTYLPLSMVFCLIGTGLALHFPIDSLRDGMVADQVFPYFIKNELPSVVSGLVIAAVLAAAMSTVDSSLNSSSTVVLVDFFQRLKLIDQRVPGIIILRTSTVILGVLGTAGAVLMYETAKGELQTIMDRWWAFAGLAGGGMFGLFIVAWVMPRLPSWAALVGVLVTLPVLAWGIFARDIPEDSQWAPFECPLHPNLNGVAATLALLAVAAVVMLMVRQGLVRPNPRADEQ